MNKIFPLFALMLLFVSPQLFAESGALSAVTVTTNAGGDQEYSVTLQV